jgi:hypothetical protein
MAVVIVGMGLLGMLLRSVDSRPGDASADPTILFLPFLLLPLVAKQEMDYIQLCASIPQILVISWLATRIVTATRMSRGLPVSRFAMDSA